MPGAYLAFFLSLDSTVLIFILWTLQAMVREMRKARKGDKS